MRPYLLLFLLLLSYAAIGQSIQGTVTDAATGNALYPVTVVNLRTQQSVYTNERGFYTIAANNGDPIAFAYMGYKTVQVAKPVSVLIATLNITLVQQSYQLSEFVLRPGHLTQYQKDSLERRSIYKLPLQRSHPSSIMSPVSALAELFSHKARSVYRFQREFKEGETQKFIDLRYTAELVTGQTGLTGDSIGHFMFAYPMAYDFSRNATDLELKMWIRTNYREWVKRHGEDSAKR